MGRKAIGEKPLTGAEKQKRFREKRKAEFEALKATAATGEAPDMGAIRETVKQELRNSWEPEIKAERIAEQRKEGRKLARKADNSYAQGRITGLCQAAAYFIGKERADIAQALLSHFMIDRETAAAALQHDQRTRSLTLESLDKAGAWGKPPEIIK